MTRRADPLGFESTTRAALAVIGVALLQACLGAPDRETIGGALVDPPPDSDSCIEYAAAIAEGSVEADVPGVVAGDEIWEWSDVAATWTTLQEPGDVDEWSFPLRDAPGLALNPWVGLEQTDMILHAWPKLCAYYEGSGHPACFVGSNPTTRPSPTPGAPDQFGCCRAVDEYGHADVWLSLDGTFSNDDGVLHVTVESQGRSCGGYWLMVAGQRPDDA